MKIKNINIQWFGAFLPFMLISLSLSAQEVDSLAISKMQELTEIVIKGDLPNTRLKGNSMITRIEGTALSSAGSLGEMLVNVPGMTGREDNPEVLGRGTPIIYINGRQIRDISELQRVRSEDVRDVEVINNPGTQYDATVRSVVRIRTRRQQGEGVSLDFVARDDQDLRYAMNTPNIRLNLNYRKNNIDLFGGLHYWHQDYRQYSWLEETTLTSKTFQQKGPYTMTWKNDNMVYTAGMDWQPSENQSLGLRVDMTQRLGDGTNQVIYDEDISENSIFIDHLYDVQTSKEQRPLSFLTNAYYNGKVGKMGIDFNFDFMNSEINTDRVNREQTTKEQEMVFSNSGTNSKLYASKLVLSYPVWKGTMEAGSEMTFAKRHNTYSIDKSSIDNTDADIHENNIAAFAQYSCDLDRWGNASAGIRYEHTMLDYDDRLGDGDLHRQMDEWFPFASYNTQIGKVQLGLSYSMKTNRPSFFAMNDAVTYISRYSMQAGNSQLLNERIHSLTLNLAWRWLTFTTSYDRQKHAISQWAFLLPEDAVLIKHINLDHPVNTISAYIGATPHVGIWSLNATLGIQKQYFYLDLEDNDGNISREHFNRPIYFASAFNSFDLKNDWKIDVDLDFTSSGHQQNFYNDYNAFVVGADIQKTLLRDKSLTLRAAISDIFQRSRMNEYGNMGFYRIQQNNRFSRHKLSLTVSYRFNSARNHYKGTGAGRDAQTRMKN